VNFDSEFVDCDIFLSIFTVCQLFDCVNVFLRVLTWQTDPTYGHLLVEGYLTKLQPFSNGFSRTRWFVLTTTQLLYFQEEAGQVMARCEAPNFENIVERGENCFVIHGKVLPPFFPLPPRFFVLRPLALHPHARGSSCAAHAQTPFSKSGADMVTCQCESRLVRDKWIQSFRQIRSFKVSQCAIIYWFNEKAQRVLVS
jgi:hypothetical protein